MRIRMTGGLVLTAGVILSGAAVWGQEVSGDIKHDVSPALRSIIAPPGDFKPLHEKRLGRIPAPPSSGLPDPVIQSAAGPKVAVTNGLNFDGVGTGFTGPNGTFTVNAAPPDTNGAVGATQFAQWVNSSFAVFDKTTGNPVMGPTAG